MISPAGIFFDDALSFNNSFTYKDLLTSDNVDNFFWFLMYIFLNKKGYIIYVSVFIIKNYRIDFSV